MNIYFSGANHEVTGSCTMLTVGDKAVLVDCGMEQGRDVFENIFPPVPPKDIDYVFLTHAHIDHSGNLPLLYKQGFRGEIFATAETCDLCEIMLRDSAHIQLSDAQYRARKAKRAGRKAPEPLYSLEDAENVLRLFRRCEYNRRMMLNENISLSFTDVGHLLGSACIEVWLSEGTVQKKIVFSGDVGNTDQPIINDPGKVSDTDYLVIESTYGNRLHDSRQKTDTAKKLADVIQRTLDRKGNLVIPSFAVGRTQEILYFIREIKERGLVENHDGFPVYVDSPLANEATGIYMQCNTACLDPDILAVMQSGVNPLVFDGLKTYVTIDESKRLNADTTPKVIISASGMCDAGRVCHHLKYNLWRKECTVLFVGYQAEGSLGRRIHDGEQTVRIFGEDIAVNAEITDLIGVSGHADRDGLIDWMSGFERKPSQVFVNHGDDSSCTDFCNTLNDLGYNAAAPFSGTEYDLAAGKFVRITEGVPTRQKQTYRSASPELSALIAAVRKLGDTAQLSEGIPNKELRRFTEDVNELCRKWSR